MKNTFKTVISVVLSLIPVVSLFSQTTGPRVQQTVPDKYEDKGGLVYSKQTQGPNAAGEYTIFLKTFVTGTVSSQEQHIPSDFILVLDVSGSMAWVMGQDYTYPSGNQKSRLRILKDAVSTFVGMVKQDAIDNSVDNRIAIVKFADDSYPSGETWQTLSEGDDMTGSSNYTQIVKTFRSVNTDAGAKEITDAVEDLNYGGTTAADYGMHKALALINKLLETPSQSNKTVVLFTDGDPTHDSSFQDNVANTTIQYAEQIKAKTAYTHPVSGDVKCKVYTIGTFAQKPSNTSKRGRYMQRVSSNYTGASSMYDGNGNNNGGYYFVASNASELEAAFATIQQDQSSASIDLGSSATAVDVVSQSFDIPYIKDEAGNISTDVKVWTAPLSNITVGADGKSIYAFPTTNLEPAEGVTLVVDPLTGSVSVTGFDYTDNACAMVNGRPVGNQLIIEIPIKMANNAVGGLDVQTNGPGSGIKYKEKQQDGSYVDRIITFDSPDINLPTNLEIEKVGLNDGESARFLIQRKLIDSSTAAWEDYSTVFITKKKDNTGFSKDCKVKIVGLDPDYVYRIIEDESWGWSYGGTTVTGLKYDDTGAIIPVTDMTNGTAAQNWNDNTVLSTSVMLNPITFTNKKKDAQVRYAESIVINSYKGVTEETAGHTENSKEQPK